MTPGVLDDLLGPSLAERQFSQGQRQKSASKKHALPDGSYPIETKKDLENAKQAVGRAKPGKRAAVKAHIKKREKALAEAEAILARYYAILAEAADSMAKASTPEPFSKSKTSNWVARAGGLPAYIQHIAHDLVEKRGKSESNAIQMAIGIVKNWASGQGKVDANTRAAASKAVAQWEAMKAKNKAKVKEALEEAEGDDADLDWDALLAQIRAQPKAYPIIANVMTFFAASGTHPMDYPEGEGADNIVEWQTPPAFHGAAPVKQFPKKTSTGTRTRTAAAGSSSGGATTSRQRWAKYDSLHSGTSGAPVQGVQARVGAKVDGQYGPKTVAKVEAFQKKKGLQVDGVVGRQTFAALAGHKNASSVKVGKLSPTQASQLANFAKHGGTLMTRSSASRRARRLSSAPKLHAALEEALLGEPSSAEEVLADMLWEAERATHAEFPSRVKALKQGEVARMPDGVAVKRFSTQDGRDSFQVGDAQRSGEPDYYGSVHRKADDAIKAAQARSVRSTDPESIGGETPYWDGDPVDVAGKEAKFAGVDPDGDGDAALVQHKGRSRPTSVPFAQLSSRSGSLGESALGVADHYTPFG